MACVAVNSLVRTLEIEYLQPQPRSIVEKYQLISCNIDLIQSLHQKLEFLMEMMDESRMKGVEAIKDLEIKLRDVAFRVEDEIELQIVDLYEEEGLRIASLLEEKPKGNTTLHSNRLCHIMQQAIEDIDAIKEKLEKVDGFPKFEESIMKVDSSQHASHPEEIMVGRNNEFNIIMDKLIQHPSEQREVVVIEGTAGIGKTTLAIRVYEDPSIVSHFDKRAWCVASQYHNKRRMLEGLLKSIFEKDISNSDNEGDLVLRLYQCFKGQRYFVVIDDVWSEDAWDAIKAFFPDDRNGSRVLLTTRLAKVTNYTCSHNNFSLQMQLLDLSESWDLFNEKACKSLNAEFERIGKRIVGKCKGLPLAIVVVAGLLSKLNTLNEWENIAKTLNSSIITTIDDECLRILSWSYNYLPHNLKACFLYLGVFPEDEEIKANTLARLWSAEGLVKAYKNQSYDVVAKRYIKELMDRNLILVSRQSCCGRKIKAFRVHDLLHAFCVREAQNENLLHIICENSSNLSLKGFRWVSIQSESFEIAMLYPSLKYCRSIFCFREDISLNLQVCNLLRVYSTKSFFYENIMDLVHLRYISLDCYTLKLDNAWNLQTLRILLKDEDMNYLEFPQLQYFFCVYMRGHLPKFVHRNLQSILLLKPSQCTKKFFANIPYVKKVGIEGKRRDCNECMKNLVYLQQLERLSVAVLYEDWDSLDMISINKQVALLKNLKKLTFVRMRFEWKEINVLCKLPMLEVLRLINSAFVGKEWELPEEDKFCQLIVLEIKTTDLKQWKASGDQFPKLERLLLSICWKLEEIPIEFAEIPTLKSIELHNCLLSAVDSAKQIQEEQCDYGNDDMVVIEKFTIESVEDEDESYEFEPNELYEDEDESYEVESNELDEDEDESCEVEPNEFDEDDLNENE